MWTCFLDGNWINSNEMGQIYELPQKRIDSIGKSWESYEIEMAVVDIEENLIPVHFVELLVRTSRAN